MSVVLRKDDRAFLLFAYGFETQQAALNHARANSDHYAAEDSYDLVRTDLDKCYLPRLWSRDPTWDYQALLLGTHSGSNGEEWIAIRRMKDGPRPAGSYNVLLLMEGVREYQRLLHGRSMDRLSPLQIRLMEAERDCYASWLHMDGTGIRSNLNDLDDKVAVRTTRSARGALFSLEPAFDREGEIIGHAARAVLIEASILDRDPGKDDMLRIRTFALGRPHGERVPDCTPEKLIEQVGDEWKVVLARAVAGFKRECKIIRPALDKIRLQHQAWERALQEDDQKPWKEQFRQIIMPLNWQRALRLVGHPLQLEVLIRYKCDSQFDASPEQFDCKASRVSRMLKQHECSDERRAELQSMVDEWVAPRDSLWNYTGD